jgi:death-on-curing protein
MSEFLTKIEILAIHDEQIQRFGGSQGLTDEGTLEAALFRPQTGYYADLIEEASALGRASLRTTPLSTATSARRWT